jgi:hypothetical protein
MTMAFGDQAFVSEFGKYIFSKVGKTQVASSEVL